MLLLEWPAIGWLVVAIVAAIVEISIPHFGLIFVALGAAAATLAAVLDASGATQIAVFVAAFAASLLAIRPRLLARLSGPGIPSRTGQLLGKDAVVTHDIDPTLGTGRVNVAGEDWAAHGPYAIPAGTPVRIVGADGIVLEVKRS